jgi:glycosyltransferase involved in cell wall biosynthesis
MLTRNVYASDDMHEFSLVVPVYNEGSALHGTLERLHAYLNVPGSPSRGELIVVDDGSSDGSAAVVALFSAQHPGAVRFLRHPANLGLAAALATGAGAARTRITVVLDADLSYAPETAGRMAAALTAANADCAIASPYMRGGSIAGVPFVRMAASVGANLLLAALARGRVKTLTGMVRAYSTPLLCDLLARRGAAEFNSWAAARMLAEHKRIVEIPARLKWPAHRRVSAGRTDPGKLWSRTVDVLRAAKELVAPGPSSTVSGPANQDHGTFVPSAIGDGLIGGRR